MNACWKPRKPVLTERERAEMAWEAMPAWRECIKSKPDLWDTGVEWLIGPLPHSTGQATDV